MTTDQNNKCATKCDGKPEQHCDCVRKFFVNAREMVWNAKKGHYAVGQFNVSNLEWARAILESAQEMKSPVILGISQSATQYMGGFDVVSWMIAALIKDLKITVPVALHYDHGPSYDLCKAALESGFSSIMYDGSALPLDQNIANTQKVAAMCKEYGASCEGEVGPVAGEEDEVNGSNIVHYAEEADCLRFVKEVPVDFFAATLGSVHGHYTGLPKLKYSEMKSISEKTSVPLVLHGGSGIPDNDIKQAIASGEAKININTECQDAFMKATKEYFDEGLESVGRGWNVRNLLKPGFQAIKEVVKYKIRLFGCDNKA